MRILAKYTYVYIHVCILYTEYTCVYIHMRILAKYTYVYIHVCILYTEYTYVYIHMRILPKIGIASGGSQGQKRHNYTGIEHILILEHID